VPNYQSLARKAARQVGVDPGLFTSLVQHESGFRPGAGSPAGARGLTQLMPGTAASLARRYGIDTSTPYGNLLGGAHYLKEQLDRFGDEKLALAAYNAGPGAVAKYGGVPPYAETQAYVRNVLGSSKRTSGPPSLLGPPATVGAPASSGVDVQSLIMQNLGDIAMGTTTPLESLTGLNEAIAAQPQPSPSESLGTALAQDTSQFKATGSPVPGRFLSSEGGEHPTLGLPGYPAHDFFAKAGSPVVAPVAGTIVKLSGHDPRSGPTQGPHGPFGWSVYIRGDDGKLYYMTHLGSRSVRDGQRVRGGAQIGTVGDYARYGTPSHVHMGVAS
jgi:murein DD-endopeptidase MepM/ murein hydrolase activator NlpD